MRELTVDSVADHEIDTVEWGIEVHTSRESGESPARLCLSLNRHRVQRWHDACI